MRSIWPESMSLKNVRKCKQTQSNRKTDIGGLGSRDGKYVVGTRKILGEIDMFVILIVVIILWMYTYVMPYQIAYFQYVWFIVCQLYLNKTVKTKIIHLKFLVYSNSLFSLIAPGSRQWNHRQKNPTWLERPLRHCAEWFLGDTFPPE